MRTLWRRFLSWLTAGLRDSYERPSTRAIRKRTAWEQRKRGNW